MGVFWSDFLKFATATSVFTLALYWLTKTIITHWLSKDLEAHKLKLEAQNGAALERLKADLEMAAKEREIRFGALHAKRVKGLVDLFIALENGFGQVATIVGAASMRGVPPLRISGDGVKEINAALPLFRRNLLYLDADLVDRIQAYITEVRNVDLADDAVAYWKEHRPSIRQRLSAIEADFRRLLGPELSPPEPSRRHEDDATPR